MTRAWEDLLVLLLTGALCYLAWGLWRLGAFYLRRWRVRREFNSIVSGDPTLAKALLERLSLDGIARMERKP